MNFVERARAIMLDPRAEWPKIEQEAADPVYLFTRYVALLAIVPAVSGLIGGALIGVTLPGIGSVREPFFAALFAAIFGYVASFVSIFLLAAIIELLAPFFGTRRNFAAAVRLAVYSYTPAWLAGIFLLLPGLRFLNLLGLYGAYLLWTGLPPLMKVPKDKAPIFAAVMVVCAVILAYLAGTMQREIFAS
jgi:hypothetical protein